MVDKNFIGLDKPDITRFESYLPTAFSSELTLLQKINKIIQDLNRSFDLSNEMVEYLNRFIETFDEKLYETIEDVLTVWLEDGRLANIVRVAISEEVIEARTDYLGQTYLTLKERLDLERKEVIDGRGGSETLGDRLDSDMAEVSTQLAQIGGEFETFEIAQDLINNNKSPIWFNVKNYGAKGDGVTDDTASIQHVHSLMSNFKGSTMYFPAGNYLVSVEEHELMKGNSVILPKSFENFIFDKNAVMIMTPNDYPSYNIFLIENANNILISGGTLRGEKDKHFGTTGEFGKGVFIFKNAHDVVIKNMIIENFWGDGIEIGFYVSENEQNINGFIKSKDIYNIVIDSCELRFNRRQGISVIYTYGLIVKNCHIHNTGGARPEAGIDLEPNFVTTIIDNILIENNLFENNSGMDIESIGGQKDNLVIRNNVFNKGITVFATHNLDFNNNVLNNCLIKMSRTVELTNNLSFKNNVFNNSHFETYNLAPYVLNVGHVYIEDNYFNMKNEKNRVLILTENFASYLYKTLDFKNNVIDVTTNARQDNPLLTIAQTFRHINVSNNIYNLNETTQPTMLSFIYPNSYSLNFVDNKMYVGSGVVVNEHNETSMVSAGVNTKVINVSGNDLTHNAFTPRPNYLIIVRYVSLLKLLNNNTNRGIAKINDITELNTRDYALISGNVGKTGVINASVENYALIDNNYSLNRLG